MLLPSFILCGLFFAAVGGSMRTNAMVARLEHENATRRHMVAGSAALFGLSGLSFLLAALTFVL